MEISKGRPQPKLKRLQIDSLSRKLSDSKSISNSILPKSPVSKLLSKSIFNRFGHNIGQSFKNENLDSSQKPDLSSESTHPNNFSPSAKSTKNSVRINSPFSPISTTSKFSFVDFKSPPSSSRSVYRQKLGHASTSKLYKIDKQITPSSPNHKKLDDFINTLNKETTKDIKAQFKHTKNDLEDLIKDLKKITNMDTDEVL